jgi:small subunit ribosomal protein S6
VLIRNQHSEEAKYKLIRFLSTAQPSKMVKSSNPEERRFQMRQYELILIVQPDLEEEATNVVIERVKNMIIDNDGQIIKTDIWGSKHLAYEIQDFRDGYYVYMEVEFAPEFGTELKQNLRYIEPIIRYMLTKKEN